VPAPPARQCRAIIKMRTPDLRLTVLISPYKGSIKRSRPARPCRTAAWLRTAGQPRTRFALVGQSAARRVRNRLDLRHDRGNCQEYLLRKWSKWRCQWNRSSVRTCALTSARRAGFGRAARLSAVSAVRSGQVGLAQPNSKLYRRGSASAEVRQAGARPIAYSCAGYHCVAD
jgi:hypothetical protein